MKAENELGPLISTYRPIPPTWGSRIFLVFLCTLAILLPLGYGSFRIYYDYMHFGPVAAFFWNWPLFLLSLVSIIITICLVLVRFRRSHHYIAVHQNGLRLQLTRPIKLLWGQIDGLSTEITQKYGLMIPQHTQYSVVLFPKFGSPININEPFENLPELVTRMKACLYPRLSLSLKAGFQTGECLHFGPVKVQNGWIQIKSRKFPWSQVKQVTVRMGDLMVELDNYPTYRIPVSKIPNLEILFELIEAGVNA